MRAAITCSSNQPALRHNLATLFASRADAALRAASLPPWDMRAATRSARGHARDEHRRLIASTALNDSLDWPSVAPVGMIERTWHAVGETHMAVRYAITRLPPAVADAARLLTLLRTHWGIENGLHDVKEVTLGEDRSTLHAGAGPIVMAMLRDTAISVLHRAGWRTIAARLRYHRTHPEAALALCGLLPPNTHKPCCLIRNLTLVTSLPRQGILPCLVCEAGRKTRQ